MPHLFISPPCLPPGNHLSYCLIVLSFPQCYRLGIIQCVDFSDYHLLPFGSSTHSNKSTHLEICIIRFFSVFSWLGSSFLIIVKQYSIILVSHWCFLTHLLKDILVAPNLGQLWIKLLYKFMCMETSTP